MTNRTPTEVIAAVEAWASHALTQPNDTMCKDVAAVLAMAEWVIAFSRWRNAPTNENLRMMDEASSKSKAALSAAGVGGGE